MTEAERPCRRRLLFAYYAAYAAIRIMADAAGPPQQRPRGRLASAASGTPQLGASPLTPAAAAMGSKHGNDREKPRPWEMPVAGRG
jgi:hypothetical protein